jgi:hypothetical protein
VFSRREESFVDYICNNAFVYVSDIPEQILFCMDAFLHTGNRRLIHK